MLSIIAQIESGRLVCPVTRQSLVARDDYLETRDGLHRYAFTNGVAVLFPDAQKQKQYLDENAGEMNREYMGSRPGRLKCFLRRVVNRDYRSRGYHLGFRQVIAEQLEDALCLSIGGGPNREHPNLVNLNIGSFPNVDIVADAYRLPYADNSVDAVYCEAVLEHIELPDNAVAEMWRVLKSGAPVFAATPFLQWYHGYPNHFQNFTLTGHERLFARAGFQIVSSGTSVGPTVALCDLAVSYVNSCFPTRFIGRLAGWGVRVIVMFVRPLDLWMNKDPNSHRLASATYVHAIKTVKD